MTTQYDYETRWRILENLIISESKRALLFDHKICEGSEMARVMRWMLAIDNGIRDVEQIKRMKEVEDDKNARK